MLKNNIQMKHVITNGPSDTRTLIGYEDEGWILIGTMMAKSFHPYALNTDMVSFFAKPINKEALDKELDELREGMNDLSWCEVKLDFKKGDN